MTYDRPVPDNVIDVVERHRDCKLEEIRGALLTAEEREDLHAALTQYYARVEGEEAAEGRSYLAHVSLPDNSLSPALLYADEIVLRDPLDAWVTEAANYVANGARPRFDHWEGLTRALKRLRALEPLVRSGEVRLAATDAPRWLGLDEHGVTLADRYAELDPDRQRHGLLYAEDRRWQEVVDQYGDVDPHDPEVPRRILAMEGWDWFLDACTARAQVVPVSHWEWEYTKLRAEELHSDTRCIANLVQADLPYLEGLDARDVVALRSHDAFGEWRAEIRSAVRSAQIRSGDDPLAMIKATREEVTDVVDRLRHRTSAAVSRSEAIKAALREQTLLWGAGGIAGASLDLTTPSTMATAAVAAGLRIGYASIFGAKEEPGPLAIVQRFNL